MLIKYIENGLIDCPHNTDGVHTEINSEVFYIEHQKKKSPNFFLQYAEIERTGFNHTFQIFISHYLHASYSGQWRKRKWEVSGAWTLAVVA